MNQNVVVNINQSANIEALVRSFEERIDHMADLVDRMSKVLFQSRGKVFNRLIE